LLVTRNHSPRQTLRVRVDLHADSWVSLTVEVAAEVLRAKGERVVVERGVLTGESGGTGTPVGSSLVQIWSEGTLDEARARRTREDWALACAAIFELLHAVERHSGGARN